MKQKNNTESFIKGCCPECNSERATVIEFYSKILNDEYFHFSLKYFILECRGCGYYYFMHTKEDYEESYQVTNEHTGEIETYIPATTEYWPPPVKRKPPDWIYKIYEKNSSLHKLLYEIYTALNHGLNVLVAIGIRTAFEKTYEVLELDLQKQTFKAKLSELVTKQLITAKDEQLLSVITDGGSAAAHRAWSPNLEQLNGMLDIFESFLNRVFVLGDIGSELDKKIPKRNK